MKFVIYAPSYDENQGGVIVLHKLCDLLNRMGHEALLWPMGLPRNKYWYDAKTFLLKGLCYGTRLYSPSYQLSERYITPIAKKTDVDNAVVVYPEITRGNPLHAPRYVRWFLHRPGFHTGKTSFNSGDLYFYYQKVFSAYSNGLICGGRLSITEYFTDIYTCRNTNPRGKVCYMIRKGRDRSDLPDLSDKWVVDGLSHTEMSRAFNECDRCYFFDLQTMYTSYAALCGCIPIVVPEAGLSKEDWIHEEELRYGIAYGEDDIPNAFATRQLMFERLIRCEEENYKYVKQFLEIVQIHFTS